MERVQETQRPVLIVDDDPAIREWLKETLEDELYSVAIAANGRDALQYIAGHNRPCLILLDLMMPIMNGYEFLAEQRRQSALSDIPVVVFSAFTAPENAAETLGVTEYLPKPVNMHRLLSLLQRYCEGSAAF